MKDSLLADIFYKLAEVAEGKKEIDDVIKEVTNDDKNAGWLKEKYNEFSSFVSNLRNNIRSEYDKAKKFNDLDREYDMRNTVSVKLPNGQEGYSVGKPRDKSIKEDARDYAKGLFNDLGDLTSEKIGFKDFAKRRAEEARRSVARSTKLNSVLDAAGR